MIAPGQWAVALKNISQGDALVDADGILPPTLLAEVMAQTAGLAVAADMPERRVALLVEIDRFRCRRQVRAGEQLLVSARVLRRFGGNVKVRASIRAGRRWGAACELVLHFPPNSSR